MRIYKLYLKKLCCHSFFIKIFVLLVLCVIHDFTKYKVCRSIRDLFYWPEGPCLDMIVIFAYMVDVVLILYELIYKYVMAMKDADNGED